MPQRTTLLSLRGEIQDRIYGYVLKKEGPIFFEFSSFRPIETQIDQIRNSTVKLDKENVDACLADLENKAKNLDEDATGPTASRSSTYTAILRVNKLVYSRAAIALLRVNELVITRINFNLMSRMFGVHLGVETIPTVAPVDHASMLTFWLEAGRPTVIESMAFDLNILLGCTSTLRKLRLFFKLPEYEYEQKRWMSLWSNQSIVEVIHKTIP